MRDCSETECLAATAISDDAWADLIAAGMVQIAFPIAANQRILVDVPMTGLDDATKAMNVAQTTPLGAPQKAGASGLAAPANPTQSVP